MALGRSYSVGIDIGTAEIKVLVAEYPTNPENDQRHT
jgi:cell division ATPase FtsA